MSEQKPLKTGAKAPAFCLPDKEGNKVCLKEFAGKWVVLYFYPKDNTPGCTREAIEFTGALKDFEEAGAVILGVSPDSPKSHAGFCAKHDLRVTLLSDADHAVLDKYGAWQLKKMYGKEYHGVNRSTVLIDPQGKIAHVWDKVKVDGHAAEVLDAIKSRA